MTKEEYNDETKKNITTTLNQKVQRRNFQWKFKLRYLRVKSQFMFI